LIWKNNDYDKAESVLIQNLFNSYSSQIIDEDKIRELSRKDPWTNIWNCAKSEIGVFGIPASSLSDEQRMIISWSRIYDSIHESPDCPADEVMQDDDLLDGWLIFQHKKREKEKKEQYANNKAAQKGDEVYLFADNQQDAEKIYAMNTGDSKAIIKNRQKQIDKSKKGVSVEHTLDAQLELRRQAMDSFAQHARK
jgi:hypothetical protein